MTCFQLSWLILGIIFVAENGQRSVVSGMPVDTFDGSRLCDFNFRAVGAEEVRSHIAFEVVYRDTNSVLANSTNCNMEFWRDAIGLGMPPGNKRSLDQLEVQLTRENGKLFKVEKQTIKLSIRFIIAFLSDEIIVKIVFNDSDRFHLYSAMFIFKQVINASIHSSTRRPQMMYYALELV